MPLALDPTPAHAPPLSPSFFSTLPGNNYGPESQTAWHTNNHTSQSPARPHLVVDMLHSNVDHSTTIVCPWHRRGPPPFMLRSGPSIHRYDRYDLDLAAGKSETGFRACIYKVSDSPSQMERRKFWLKRRKTAVLEGISRGLMGRTNLPAETSPTSFWI